MSKFLPSAVIAVLLILSAISFTFQLPS